MRSRILGNTVDLKSITSIRVVTPAKTGVQEILKNLDSGLRRNDEPNM